MHIFKDWYSIVFKAYDMYDIWDILQYPVTSSLRDEKNKLK